MYHNRVMTDLKLIAFKLVAGKRASRLDDGGCQDSVNISSDLVLHHLHRKRGVYFRLGFCFMHISCRCIFHNFFFFFLQSSESSSRSGKHSCCFPASTLLVMITKVIFYSNYVYLSLKHSSKISIKKLQINTLDPVFSVISLLTALIDRSEKHMR